MVYVLDLMRQLSNSFLFHFLTIDVFDLVLNIEVFLAHDIIIAAQRLDNTSIVPVLIYNDWFWKSICLFLLRLATKFHIQHSVIVIIIFPLSRLSIIQIACKQWILSFSTGQSWVGILGKLTSLRTRSQASVNSTQVVSNPILNHSIFTIWNQLFCIVASLTIEFWTQFLNPFVISQFAVLIRIDHIDVSLLWTILQSLSSIIQLSYFTWTFNQSIVHCTVLLYSATDSWASLDFLLLSVSIDTYSLVPCLTSLCCFEWELTSVDRYLSILTLAECFFAHLIECLLQAALAISISLLFLESHSNTAPFSDIFGPIVTIETTVVISTTVVKASYVSHLDFPHISSSCVCVAFQWLHSFHAEIVLKHLAWVEIIGWKNICLISMMASQFWIAGKSRSQASLTLWLLWFHVHCTSFTGLVPCVLHAYCTLCSFLLHLILKQDGFVWGGVLLVISHLEVLLLGSGWRLESCHQLEGIVIWPILNTCLVKHVCLIVVLEFMTLWTLWIFPHNFIARSFA